MEDQDRDHISSRSHFSGRSEQELDEMLDELRAGKIGINQPGQNSSEHDSEDTPEENDNASGTGNAAKSKKGTKRRCPCMKCSVPSSLSRAISRSTLVRR